MNTERLVVRCGCGVAECDIDLVVERVAPREKSTLIVTATSRLDSAAVRVVLQHRDAVAIAEYLRGEQ